MSMVYLLKFADAEMPQFVFSSVKLAAQHYAQQPESVDLHFDCAGLLTSRAHEVVLMAYGIDDVAGDWHDSQRRQLFYDLVQRFRSGS